MKIKKISWLLGEEKFSSIPHIEGVFGSICEMEREWNQIRGNDNENCYFVKLFGSDKKQNQIIYDSLSSYLFYLYR